MNDLQIKLAEREVHGKQVKRLRNAGFVPGVVYRDKKPPLLTQAPFLDLTKVVQTAGKHTPIHLELDGKSRLAIIKNIDIDPVKHTVRHVVFQTIKQNEAIETEVPIVLEGAGESPAEKAGLIVLQALEQVAVKALPAQLPEALRIKTSELETTDDKITLADIRLPEGVSFADPDQDLSLVVANVYEPSALAAANEAAGGEAEAETEPEVVGGEPDENTETNEA